MRGERVESRSVDAVRALGPPVALFGVPVVAAAQISNLANVTEIEVQHRVVGGWALGLNHREFIGEAALEGNLIYKRGTGAFGVIPAPEELFGEGTLRMKFFTADLTLNVPFMLGGQALRYSGLWRPHANRTRLTPQDFFSIGGRYTVRDFKGESSLMGEHGWLIRNDIGWSIPASLGLSGAELYPGIDYGQVDGPTADQLLGAHFAGGVLGLRGAFQGLNYDVFRTPSSQRASPSTTASKAGGAVAYHCRFLLNPPETQMEKFAIGYLSFIVPVLMGGAYLLTFGLRFLDAWLKRLSPPRDRVFAMVCIAVALGFVIGCLLEPAWDKVVACHGTGQALGTCFLFSNWGASLSRSDLSIATELMRAFVEAGALSAETWHMR